MEAVILDCGHVELAGGGCATIGCRNEQARDDLDLTLDEAKELMADGEPAEIVCCADCVRPYENPFASQPLRFLWWLDYSLHRRHTVNWFQRQLCNFVDRMLLRGL